MKNVLIIAAISLMFLLSSCEDSKEVQSDITTLESFVSVSPNDKATNIGITEAIKFKFASPVNPITFENNFTLISQSEMADKDCPISVDMGHSDMGMAMQDSTMMQHLKKYHQTTGRFKWNSDNTMCEFQPQTALISSMDYMVFIDAPMVSSMKEIISNSSVMGKLSMMDCDCMKNGPGNKKVMMMHFKTRKSDS